MKKIFRLGFLTAFQLIASAQSTQVCSLEGAEARGPSTFEVASVRESAPSEHFSQRLLDKPRSSDFIAVNLWPAQLIADAFGVDFQFQVDGVPDWISRRRFDIQAKADGCRATLARRDEASAKASKQQIVQSLFLDRFKLKYRIETHMLPSNNLVQTTKGGHFISSRVPAHTVEPDFRSTSTSQGIEIVAKHVDMETLTRLLRFYMKSSMTDGTGLHDTYDFVLRFKGLQIDDPSADLDTWPPLQVAVQEQLGLKLVASKKATPVVVVEQIALPTPN